MNRKGFAPILFLLIVGLLLVGGGAWYYEAHQSEFTQTVSPTAEVSSTASSYTSIQHATGTATNHSIKVSIGATVQTTVSCATQDCFNKDFASCTPASITNSAGGLGAASYKIIGPVTGGCKVTFVYTANPNPAWVNQPMTCTLNDAIDFQTSFQNAFNAVLQGGGNCTGPFVPILKGVKSTP